MSSSPPAPVETVRTARRRRRPVALAAALGCALAVPAAATAAPRVPDQAAAAAQTAQVAQATPAPTGTEPFDALVFSRTAGFRHDSIPAGIAALQQLGSENGFTVTATEDPAAFTDENLAQYEVVVWLSTTGDVLDETQQGAFERYVEGGGGYAGVHAASDTEYDWPWYGELVGAYFDGHPPGTPTATVDVEDHDHVSTAHLPQRWERTDEWYNYEPNPRGDVHVLATLDESTYEGGTMGEDHPIAWCHTVGEGRSWYTGGGHTAESFTEPLFVQHLLGGVQSAAGAVESDCPTPEPPACETGEPAEGYRHLFDGTAESFAQWRMAGPGEFVLEDDCTLRTVGGLGLLYHPDAFGSYSLTLEWKMAGDDNSGVFVGFPDPGDDPWLAVYEGHEIQIDATDADDRTTGAIYAFQGADLAARDAALNPPGEWNSYEIVVEGDRIQVILNDVLVNDFTDTDPARMNAPSHVGLQNHGDGDEVYFRDVQIRELDEADTTGPEITVVGADDGATYGVSDVLDLTWEATDDGSGVAEVSATLDGEPVEQGPVLLRDLELGTHVLVATATDVAGNTTTVTITFDLVTSFADVATMLDQLVAEGVVAQRTATALALPLGRAEAAEAAGDDVRALASLRQLDRQVDLRISDEAAAAALHRSTAGLMEFFADEG